MALILQVDNLVGPSKSSSLEVLDLPETRYVTMKCCQFTTELYTSKAALLMHTVGNQIDASVKSDGRRVSTR